MKQTHDDIIEAKEVYIQQSFGRYKGKLVLRNQSLSVYFSDFQYGFQNGRQRSRDNLFIIGSNRSFI